MDAQTGRQVHFLINNLAPSDLADRVEMIRTAVFPEFKDWFANYLVVKRAAQVSTRTPHIYCVHCEELTLQPSGPMSCTSDTMFTSHS